MSSDELVEMPFLRNIGLVMTYKCQVACPHCIIEAGPHRREEMALCDALDWVEQIASYRNGYIKVLSLTGGEPFYDVDRLKSIASFGAEHGLIVSAVTNAFWASTSRDALSTLRRLSEIRMLAISTDKYHQEAIPFERVKNAILAAKECDIPYNVHVCTEDEDDEEHKRILNELLELTELSSINIATTFPAGRALDRLGGLRHQTSEEPPVSACAAGSSPIVFPDGRVLACIGPVINLLSSHPLLLGSLRERPLNNILDDAELNPILHTIRVWGPKRLVSMIKEAGLSQYLPKEYVRNSVCSLCYHLMSSDRMVEFLIGLTNSPEFGQKVAYARMYYLRESGALELYHTTAAKPAHAP